MGINEENGEEVAIKIIEIAEDDNKKLAEVKKEIKIFKKLSSTKGKGIIPNFFCSWKEKSGYKWLEYIEMEKGRSLE